MCAPSTRSRDRMSAEWDSPIGGEGRRIGGVARLPWNRPTGSGLGRMMLIPISGISRILHLRPRGVLHVGAHHAEERDDYLSAGWGPRTWLEALPDLADRLRTALANSRDDLVLEGAAWHTSGQVLRLNRTNLDESSSLLPLGRHQDVRPDIVVVDQVDVSTVTLDEAVERHRLTFGHRPEFLSLDIQGAELAALEGFASDVPCDWILTEVAWRELYVGQPLLADVDRHLRHRGFRRVALMRIDEAGWGDALYIRGSVHQAIPQFRRLRLAVWVQVLQFRRRLGLGRVLLHRWLRRSRRSLRAAVRSLLPSALLRARRRAITASRRTAALLAGWWRD